MQQPDYTDQVFAASEPEPDFVFVSDRPLGALAARLAANALDTLPDGVDTITVIHQPRGRDE